MGHKSEDTFTPQIRGILRIANSVKEMTATSDSLDRSRLRTSPLSVATNSINLPDPPPLMLPSLLDAGADYRIAAAAGKIYQVRAEELRQHIQESIVTAWYKIAELPVVPSASSPDVLLKKILFTATGVYLQHLGRWKEEIMQLVKQAPKLLSNTEPPTNTQAFNHECVPLLERFFEDNPFPTHADKMSLAKESNMQYRQIHVWFQNRRSRTRKGGNALRKKPMYERATKSLIKQGHMINSDSQAPKTSKAGLPKGTTEYTEIVRNNVSKDGFTSSAPPHAFPSSYPPTTHYDPFPCKNGPVYLTRPEWRRIPCAKPPLVLSTDISDLAERFSHLSVRDETRSQGPLKLQSHAATAAITIVPSRAPHPSLIVSEGPQSTSFAEPHLSVRAFLPSSKIFQSCNPSLIPTTSASLPVLPWSGTLGKREIAPLPQHLLSRTQHTRRDATPPENSPTPSSSPGSLPTDSESCGRSLSSASSLSTPSDLASIRGPPCLFRPPCRSPFDSPIRLRKDMAAVSPASVS